MFTLRHQGANGISQIKRMRMCAGAEGRKVRTTSEWHSDMHCTASIPGSNPGLPLTVLVTLGQSLNVCVFISLSQY